MLLTQPLCAQLHHTEEPDRQEQQYSADLRSPDKLLHWILWRQDVFLSWTGCHPFAEWGRIIQSFGHRQKKISHGIQSCIVRMVRRVQERTSKRHPVLMKEIRGWWWDWFNLTLRLRSLVKPLFYITMKIKWSQNTQYMKWNQIKDYAWFHSCHQRTGISRGSSGHKLTKPRQMKSPKNIHRPLCIALKSINGVSSIFLSLISSFDLC